MKYFHWIFQEILRTPGLIHSYSAGNFIFCKRPCIFASQLRKQAGGHQFFSELVSLPPHIRNPYYYPYIQMIHIIRICWIFFSGATFLLWGLIVCHSPSAITRPALRPARSRCSGLCCHQVETSVNSKDLTSKTGRCWCVNASGVALRLRAWIDEWMDNPQQSEADSKAGYSKIFCWRLCHRARVVVQVCSVTKEHLLLLIEVLESAGWFLIHICIPKTLHRLRCPSECQAGVQQGQERWGLRVRMRARTVPFLTTES